MALDLTFALAVAAVLTAGFTRGLLGFGAALIVIPALVTLYGPVEAVAIMSLIEVPATLYLAPTTVRHADWRWVAPVGVGSLLTIPLGAALLVHLDPELTRRIIAGLVIGLGLLLASGWCYRGATGVPMRLAVGGLSGFIGGLANVGGPVVVVFLLARQAAALTVRAGMMAFLSFSTLFRLAVYGALGAYTLAILALGLVLAPAYLLGIWLGSRAFDRVPEALFRRLAIAVVIVTGTIAAFD